MDSRLFFEQKKGSPNALCGNVIVYARITEPDSEDNRKSPVHEMAKGGLLAASGDYRTQHSLEDFLKKELGISLDELGNDENVSITGLPPNADPDFIRRKIESLKGYEDLIPTPAKLVHFDSEQEIESQEECDIFYLGEFARLANANLAINAFPIIYQAVYREQMAGRIAQEIEKMLSTASSEVAAAGHYTDSPDTLGKKLLTEFVPELIYNRQNRDDLQKWIDKLKAFMSGYKYPGDVSAIIGLATGDNPEQDENRQLIELFVKKIAAFCGEDYKAVGEIKKEIERLKPD